MKQFLFYSLLFLFSCHLHAQKRNYTDVIDDFKFIESMPYFPELSGDSIFWQATRYKKKIIPFLISRITDTTKTNALVPNFGGRYLIGDVCIRLIEELIEEFPTIRLIEHNNKVIKENAYLVYWEFVRKNYENRKTLQLKVTDWYNENRKRLYWVEDKRLYAVTDDETQKAKRRPVGGFYKY